MGEELKSTLARIEEALATQARELIEFRGTVMQFREDEMTLKEQVKALKTQTDELSAFARRFWEETHPSQPDEQNAERGEVRNSSSEPQAGTGITMNAPTAHSTPPSRPTSSVYRAPQDHSFMHIHLPLPPAEYDGKTPWSRYQVHFDALARANGWSYELKALYLAAYLRGTALAFYETLDHYTRGDYERTSSALRLRFNADYQQSVTHVQLRTRLQKGGESLAEYATDVQRLTQLTFSDCPESARDRIALEQFLDGILDIDVQERVRDVAPLTLQAALQTAIRIEANHRATRAARRNIRVAAAATSTTGRRDRRDLNRTRRTEQGEEPCTSGLAGNINELA